MARKLPELMGPSEVAAELGCRVQNIDKQVGLPPADQHLPLSRTRIWRAAVIREFAASRNVRSAA